MALEEEMRPVRGGAPARKGAEREVASRGPLRILHLEDDPADALLTHENLRDGGLACDVRRVWTGVL